MTTKTPSAVTLLKAARAAFPHPAGVYALLDDTARKLGVPARAHTLAANALDAAVTERGTLDAAAFDAAIATLTARRLDLDAWLADCAARRVTDSHRKAS
jgi:hypothetical protein